MTTRLHLSFSSSKYAYSGQGTSKYYIYAPFKEGGAYCVAYVGRYVGIP